MGKYIPNTDAEQKAMLTEIGFSSFEDLFADAPKEVMLKGELNIPSGLSELQVRKDMTKIAEKNVIFPTIFRGEFPYIIYSLSG